MHRFVEGLGKEDEGEEYNKRHQDKSSKETFGIHCIVHAFDLNAATTRCGHPCCTPGSTLVVSSPRVMA